ncbi:glycosyltransferase family 2 protein [Ornithinimicrobium kibberense]|uniref:Glycosyltransferase family 2 protein n=1 Tax=Ornithinimicrobium kibberense TaxID=282060 RepID=A0ABV5V718_9MICO|nr:glycosyltransferase [Ornithinimicrobium kibberense]
MGSATVSVVVPTFNTRPEFLRAAVLSAVSQDPPPLEVLVVDDGSTIALEAPDHSLVRVIRQDNRGASAARNRGIREARGELVAFLDADDLWYAGKLAAQTAAMSDPQVGLCSCDFDVLDQDGAVRAGWGGHGGNYRQLLGGNSVHTSGAIVRRTLILEVGGFDESLTHGEDWGTWLDIARRSRLAHIPEVLVRYRLHDDNASRNYRRMWQGAARVLWRHRAAVPLQGLRRIGQIYGAQAFDSFRSSRNPTDLAWSLALWPAYVARQVVRRFRRGGRLP